MDGGVSWGGQVACCPRVGLFFISHDIHDMSVLHHTPRVCLSHVHQKRENPSGTDGRTGRRSTAGSASARPLESSELTFWASSLLVFPLEASLPLFPQDSKVNTHPSLFSLLFSPVLDYPHPRRRRAEGAVQDGVGAGGGTKIVRRRWGRRCCPVEPAGRAACSGR